MKGNLRAVVVVAVSIAALALLLVVGRWEGRRHADKENAKILRIREAVGSLDRPRPTGFRILNPFTCLTYGRGANKYALELCVDAAASTTNATAAHTTGRRRLPTRGYRQAQYAQTAAANSTRRTKRQSRPSNSRLMSIAEPHATTTSSVASASWTVR